MNSNQDDKQKALKIPMTGIEVMNYLSVDDSRLFYLAQEGLLLPYRPNYLSWNISVGTTDRDPPDHNTLSQWLYLNSDVEDFKKKHKDWLEKVKSSDEDIKQLKQKIQFQEIEPLKEPAQQEREREEALVKSVWPEVIRLYNVIKSVGFNGLDVESKLKDRAKNELKTNHANYSYIKSKHLNRKKLFSLNPGQEKRDFIGLLLKIIAKDHGIKKTNYQRLYKIGTTNSSNHK